jgi:hypothetical protein
MLKRPPGRTSASALNSDQTRSEAEVIATVVYLVNSGRVRLCGNFKGARFDVRGLVAGRKAA